MSQWNRSWWQTINKVNKIQFCKCIENCWYRKEQEWHHTCFLNTDNLACVQKSYSGLSVLKSVLKVSKYFLNTQPECQNFIKTAKYLYISFKRIWKALKLFSIIIGSQKLISRKEIFYVRISAHLIFSRGIFLYFSLFHSITLSFSLSLSISSRHTHTHIHSHTLTHTHTLSHHLWE